MSAESSLVVANFNLHAGIDGWGRPFNALGACEALDADVVMLEECWRDDESIALVDELASRLGYAVVDAPYGDGRRVQPPEDPEGLGRGWGPRRGPGRVRPIRLDGPARSRRARATPAEVARPFTRGQWYAAMLSRVPVLAERVVALPQLRRDVAQRSAVVIEVDLGGRGLRIVGAHLAHLQQGSPIQMRALHRLATEPASPAVVLGDFNCWGPPLRLFLPGLSDAVRGATWPAWRPRHRIDHVLVSQEVMVLEAAVVADAGSDHRPIRCRLSLR